MASLFPPPDMAALGVDGGLKRGACVRVAGGRLLVSLSVSLKEGRSVCCVFESGAC